MKFKKAICIALYMQVVAVSGVSAQAALPATGGNASGSGGSVSFTVGQIDYTANAVPGGSVHQGVQQAYEIFTVRAGEAQELLPACSLYPNPTPDGVTLRVPLSELQGLCYQLYDASGRLLSDNPLNSLETTIPMQNLAAAAYLLQLRHRNGTIKTFKIIKY